MSSELIYTLVTGVVGCILYKFLEIAYYKVVDIWNQNNFLFSINGYWCAYHEEVDSRLNQKFVAYELVHLKYSRGNIKMRLYQLTGDSRKYFYVGIGYMRGDKVTIAYQEAKRRPSNHTGVFILRFHNIYEHSIVLEGDYHEFRGDNFESQKCAYFLKECHSIQGLKPNIKKEEIFLKMEEDYFKNECKKTL